MDRSRVDSVSAPAGLLQHKSKETPRVVDTPILPIFCLMLSIRRFWGAFLSNRRYAGDEGRIEVNVAERSNARSWKYDGLGRKWYGKANRRRPAPHALDQACACTSGDDAAGLWIARAVPGAHEYPLLLPLLP